ncbi:MAG: B12-binding domain-containing radical SAM protein [Candidatus Anammoxibacter sp.]
MKVTKLLKKTDLLLINASNFHYEPFYPYAFIMLSARARQHGVSVKRLDLSNIPEDKIGSWLSIYINRYQPRMIGFTLRQTDAYAIQDYMNDAYEKYHPIEMLDFTLQKIKKLIRVPMVVGGFGFSLHAKEILEYFDMDLGFCGCGEPLLENFENIVRGRNLSKVPNLIYKKKGQYVENERVYYPPFEGREYDDELIDEVINHYGRIIAYGRAYLALYNQGNPISFGFDSSHKKILNFKSLTPTIPIEVARGCPFNCYFCSEPIVKGRSVRYRDLDIVEEEVKFCLSKDLRNFWFVCSEINQGSNEFVLSLAERMIKLNEKLGCNPFTWTSYQLPRWLSKKDLDALYRSGFETSWNDVVSLDDTQLKKSRVPYTAKHAVKFINDDFAVRKKHGKLPPLLFSVFLGDVFLTPKSLTTTLKAFNNQRLADKCSGAVGVYAMRVFDSAANCVDLDTVVSFTSSGKEAAKLIHPSFHLPTELCRDFGDFKAIFVFFDYICGTLLSRNHIEGKDWSWFLARNCSPSLLRKMLLEKPYQTRVKILLDHKGDTAPKEVIEKFNSIIKQPSVESLLDVFYPSEKDKRVFCAVAYLLVRSVYAGYFKQFKSVLKYLDIPVDAEGYVNISEYEFVEILYRQFNCTKELIGAVAKRFKLRKNAPELMLLNYLLYQFDVQMSVKHKKWLFNNLYSE